MIKILQVVTHMNRGGLETMLMNYYRQMDRTRVQFDFMTHRPYEGDYGEEIKALGGVIYHMPRLNPFSRSYRMALKNFFLSHPEYQIIHVHQDCLSGVILKVAKECGIKVRIAHCHSANQAKDIKYPIKLFFRRSIPRYATDLMACGEEAGRWMFCGAEFSILRNAIDAVTYSFDVEKSVFQKNKWGSTADELVIGHVSNYTPAKNPLFLLEVFDKIRKKVPAKLMLVGNSQCHPEVAEKIDSLNLRDHVLTLGIRSDVADLLQAMDVFLFPSLYEGLPVTMVEAQAAGLPCVISDGVPIQCKITDAVWQVSLEKSPAQWADAVIEAAKTKRVNTYEQIKAAGYDITENARWLQNKYEEMAEYAFSK